MLVSTLIAGLTGLLPAAFACDDCYGQTDTVHHPRHSRRMQPEALNATLAPTRPLEWGQLNFLHTTDTHGWLEGHLKEQNYGADWGDFVSFSKHMRQKASNLGVDLLLVDTGDLHDGNGLSDAETPDGVLSNPIFENIDYDVLTIGNHELYLANVAYETFFNFSTVYGDKYVTSNVQILNPSTGQFQYIGQQYRYFTTEHGLRIMAFGVLYDFTGNTNVTKVTKTADLVKQQWFLDAVKYPQPIDLFLVLGHNPIRPTAGGSTFGTLYKTIRNLRPNIPIQGFGGHSHIRDFVVYDQMSTGLESGRYCETLGFLSLSGIQSSQSNGTIRPVGVPNPTTKAVPAAMSGTISAGLPSSTANASNSSMVYSRRYLDWNRLTFAYHATSSQDSTFDSGNSLRVTSEITTLRKDLNLTALYGCAPETYCMSCQPFGAVGNIFSSLLPVALGATVINSTRESTPRIIIINSGSIRFDLVQGPFTFDDSFIVSPFTDGFEYIADVPYSIASQVLGRLNSAGENSKRDLKASDFDFASLSGDICPDATLGSVSPESELKPRGLTRGVHRRQSSSTLTPGYTTRDDFGTDGDDTPHSRIPSYPQPDYIQGNGSFPTDGSVPTTVDLIFLDFFADDIPQILNGLGGKYTMEDVTYYLDPAFTTQSYLPTYAKEFWQANVPNCPTGQGVTR